MEGCTVDEGVVPIDSHAGTIITDAVGMGECFLRDVFCMCPGCTCQQKHHHEHTLSVHKRGCSTEWLHMDVCF